MSDTVKYPMTMDGYQKLKAELENLKNSERPAVIQAIAAAREHGDLSENAEYHAARERQGLIEGRITELEAKIGHAEVIDISKLSGNRVIFGAYVVLEDEDSGEKKEYQIVGGDESDVNQGRLSIDSPLARALINKTSGDSVEVTTPGGVHSYEIVKVSFKKSKR